MFHDDDDDDYDDEKYSASGKKHQNIACNIFYQTPAILMRFDTKFPE